MISQKQEILFFGDSLATMERGIKEVRSVICRRAARAPTAMTHALVPTFLQKNAQKIGNKNRELFTFLEKSSFQSQKNRHQVELNIRVF